MPLEIGEVTAALERDKKRTAQGVEFVLLESPGEPREGHIVPPEEIRAAYNQAKEAKTYESVLLYTGKKVKHYGLTDHKEYFAEGTEAYFYRNDFYPFVRAELKEHDPALHEVLAKIWGPAN